MDLVLPKLLINSPPWLMLATLIFCYSYLQLIVLLAPSFVRGVLHYCLPTCLSTPIRNFATVHVLETRFVRAICRVNARVDAWHRDMADRLGPFDAFYWPVFFVMLMFSLRIVTYSSIPFTYVVSCYTVSRPLPLSPRPFGYVRMYRCIDWSFWMCVLVSMMYRLDKCKCFYFLNTTHHHHTGW